MTIVDGILESFLLFIVTFGISGVLFLPIFSIGILDTEKKEKKAFAITSLIGFEIACAYMFCFVS